MNSLPEQLYYLSAGQPATASVVFSDNPAPTAASTITVNGTVYTYTVDWTCGEGSLGRYFGAVSARRFTDAVNGLSDDSRNNLNAVPNKDVFARVFGNKVLLYARVPGTGGNSLTLTTNTSSAFTVSGATFTSGTAPGAGPAYTPTGAANMANGQVAASTIAATLVTARATRRSVTILNMDAAINVFVGVATVTAANGLRLAAGQSISIDSATLIQVIAASGTPSVGYLETYD